MSQLFRFSNAVKRDPAIDRWMHEHDSELGAIAKCSFDVMRNCGDDVREVLHDGYPTACVWDATLAYVRALKAYDRRVFVGQFEQALVRVAAIEYHGQHYVVLRCGDSGTMTKMARRESLLACQAVPEVQLLKVCEAIP